jgi:hypothetical protein
MDLPFFVALPIVFALSDRGIGGLLRRSFVVGTLIAAAIALGWMGYGFLAVLIIVWLVYRTIPWKVGGSLTPRRTGQVLGSLARHAMPMLAVVGGSVWFGTKPEAAIPLAVYAVAATALAVAYARFVDGLASMNLGENGEANDKLEIVRGALFGLAAACSTVF